MVSMQSSRVSRLAREATPHIGLLVSGTACLLSSTLAELMLTRTGGHLLDLFTSESPASSQQNIDAAFWKIGTCIAIMAFVKHVGEFLLKLAGVRVVTRIRTVLFHALLQQHVPFFDESSTGELVSVLAADVEAVQMAVSHHLPDIVRFSVGTVCAALGMASISLRLTLMGACAAPVVGLIAAAVGSHVSRLGRDVQVQLAATNACASEGLSAARVVKAFGQEAEAARRFGVEVEECGRRIMLEMAVHKCWNACNLSLAALGTLWILRSAGHALMRGELSAGEIASLAMYGVSTGYAANDTANAWAAASSSAAKGAHALSLLDTVAANACRAASPEAQAAAAKAVAAAEGSAGIQTQSEAGSRALCVCFAEVNFSYPLAARTSHVLGDPGGSRALDCVSFTASAGHTTALVGPSGCGKSTILHLLLRFYRPSAGAVLLNGVDIASLPNEWLREHVAVVPQENILFRGTIGDNIGFGAPAAARHLWSREQREREVMKAAVAADAHTFVKDAGGYQALVGERGATLSGGQRQRIAIARALLRSPRLLLLDEATAALDSNSERAVQATLTRGGLAGTHGRATVVVVAHRLSTVREADAIVVLQHGRVEEQGTHSTLMALGGLYAKLASAATDQPQSRS